MAETVTLERKLDVKTGVLVDVFPLFDDSTIQHAHELMTARRTDASLRNLWFWTADFPMYRVEDKEAVLYFAAREQNLIFRDIQNATSQFLTNQNYVPTKEGIDEVVEASNRGAVLKVKLSDLRLQGNDKEWKYFEVDTWNPASLLPAERTFAERVYGQGDEFAKNMQMLREVGMNTTRVYVLSPDYVKSKVRGNGAIARASRLGGFDGVSRFDADGRGVDNSNNGLRGVLKESAEGAAKIHDNAIVATAQATQYTPEGILGYLSANQIKDERFAAAILNHVNIFYQGKVPKA